MKQVLIKNGGVVVKEVSAPRVSARGILVRVTHSCVSVGTEMASVQNSGMPLYKRALKQPEKVKLVLDMAREKGLKWTYRRVSGKLTADMPTGYSAAGIVVEVGEGVDEFRVGDRVACAGAGIANHAEVIAVPVNLAVKIPDGVSASDASTVTLGAIAMQGVRRVAPTLGETVAVIGLGVLGQLAAQLLRAAGCRVIGIDLDDRRLEIARQAGMTWSVNPTREDVIGRVHQLTAGHGADAVLIAAAASGNEVLRQAMNACRRKGRVVLVGDVGCAVRREDWYKKELDFLISCSYGPGRYDPAYEEGGQDYPFAYVRWTENRNMGEYLALLADGRLDLRPLSPASYPIDRAPEAFRALNDGDTRPLMVILEYPAREEALRRKVVLREAQPKNGRIRVALAGAGSFAQGVHLPNMFRLRDDFQLHAVMSRTGASAQAVAAQYGAAYETTDYDAVLADPDVDLVLIATRHDLHGAMVLAALEAGKHVFVEKPLSLEPQDLAAIAEFYRDNPRGPVLLTGYNRRFSPPIAYARSILAERTTPLIINYRMNAGYMPADHWVHGAEGGGRNLGEACHIYDLFNAFTGAEVEQVTAASITPSSEQWRRNDNFVATVRYADGSVCTLTYTALGDKAFPKETMEVFGDGKVIALHDYLRLEVHGGRHRKWSSTSQNKGHFEEFQALAACLRRGAAWPIALEDQLQSARIAFAVEREIMS